MILLPFTDLDERSPKGRLQLIHEALTFCKYGKQKDPALPGAVVGNMYVARLDEDAALAVVGESFAVLPFVDCQRLLDLVKVDTQAAISSIFSLTQPQQYAVRVSEDTYFVDVTLGYVKKIQGVYHTSYGDWLLRFDVNHLFFRSALTEEQYRVSVRQAESVDVVWTPGNVAGVMRATITNAEMRPEWRDVRFARLGRRCDVGRVLEVLNHDTAPEIYAYLDEPGKFKLNHVVQAMVDNLGGELLSEVMPIDAGWVLHVDGDSFRQNRLVQDQDVIVFVQNEFAYVIVIDEIRHSVKTVIYKQKNK